MKKKNTKLNIKFKDFIKYIVVKLPNGETIPYSKYVKPHMLEYANDEYDFGHNINHKSDDF